MTGPEHYAEAERLLSERHGERGIPAPRDVLARAQVHATLALAAATVFGPSSTEWLRVTGGEQE